MSSRPFFSSPCKTNSPYKYPGLACLTASDTPLGLQQTRPFLSIIDKVSLDFLQTSVNKESFHTSPWRKILISPTNKNEGMVLKREAIKKNSP